MAKLIKCKLCGLSYLDNVEKCPYCNGTGHIDSKIAKKNKIIDVIVFGIIGVIIVLAIGWFASTMADVGKKGDETGEEIYTKNKACELMTDTYNKCSYSYSEKRCICKRR